MAKSSKELLANIPPFGLRMQADLKDRIKAAAEENGRSMNAEIVSRLEESFSNSISEIEFARDVIINLLVAMNSEESDAKIDNAKVIALRFISGDPGNVLSTYNTFEEISWLASKLAPNEAVKKIEAKVAEQAEYAEQKAVRFLEKRGWKLTPHKGGE